jgi:hypothetical protein
MAFFVGHLVIFGGKAENCGIPENPYNCNIYAVLITAGLGFKQRFFLIIS